MNQKEWQDLVDDTFPDGAIITEARYSEETALYNENVGVQYLISNINVLSADEETNEFQVSCVLATAQSDVVVDVASIQERDYGWWVTNEDDQDPNYVFSNRLSEKQRQLLEAVRAERAS